MLSSPLNFAAISARAVSTVAVLVAPVARVIVSRCASAWSLIRKLTDVFWVVMKNLSAGYEATGGAHDVVML